MAIPCQSANALSVVLATEPAVAPETMSAVTEAVVEDVVAAKLSERHVGVRAGAGLHTEPFVAPLRQSTALKLTPVTLIVQPVPVEPVTR